MNRKIVLLFFFFLLTKTIFSHNSTCPLILPRSFIYNYIQIYKNLTGFEFFQNHIKFYSKERTNHAVCFVCDLDKTILDDYEGVRTVSCHINSNAESPYCTQIIFSKNKGAYFSKIAFVQLFYRNYSCSPDIGISPYIDFAFDELIEYQTFEMISFQLTYTCSGHILVETGINVMIHIDYLFQKVENEFEMINDTLLKLLKELNVSVENLLETGVTEKLFIALGKDEESLLFCQKETTFQCRTLQVLLESNETKVYATGPKQSSYNLKRQKNLSEILFYLTLALVLLIFMSFGCFVIFQNI